MNARTQNQNVPRIPAPSVGTTVVYATHHIPEADRYADQLIVLADGERVFDGSADALHDAVGGNARDFEAAFVAFLRERGH